MQYWLAILLLVIKVELAKDFEYAKMSDKVVSSTFNLYIK